MKPIPFVLMLAAGLAAAEGEPTPPPGAGPHAGNANGPKHQGPPPEELFKLADADGDGKVTLAELKAGLEKMRTLEKAKIFERMDTNKDGMVSKEEFLAFEPPQPPGQEGKRRPGPDAEEIMKRLDKNGDGVITADELPRRHGKDMFEEADTNGDGVVSKEEAQAFREKMKERREKEGKGGRGGEGRDGEHQPPPPPPGGL